MYLSARIARRGLYLKISLAVLFTLLIIAFPAVSKSGAANGVNTCINLLIPSLFPFLFVFDYLCGLLMPLLAKRNSTAAVFVAFLFGLVGGFPSGARIIVSLEEAGLVDKKRAALLLCSLVNAGPAYLITGVGLSLFSSVGAGTLLFLALSLDSLVCFFIALCASKKSGQAEPNSRNDFRAPDFSSSLFFAVKSTARLCSYVVIFSVISTLTANLSALAGITGDIPLWCQNALLEVTSACSLAARIGSTDGLFFCLASVSLCGLSVVFQINSFLKPRGISLLPFVLSRPIHLALSIGFLKLFLAAFPEAVSVFFSTGRTAVFAFSAAPAVSVFLFLTALIFVAGSRGFSWFTN